MTVKGILRRRWLLGAAIVMSVATVAALNWNGLMLTAAIVLSDRRPALLSDARWNDPATASAFKKRFPPGAPEDELVAWLESNNFAIYRLTGQANRLVQSMPCNEYIQVVWTTSPAGEIGDAEVRISEAGCL